jgi:predicted small lipoprotein YifL
MKTYLLGFALLTLAACGGSPLTIPGKDAIKMTDQTESAPSADAPLMVDVSPVEKIKNVARPRPASTNICPPGAPILYRGNMTCPDRF